MVAAYDLPNWIDEAIAIAMRMEDIAVEYDGLALTKESYRLHQQYRNEETIQVFFVRRGMECRFGYIRVKLGADTHPVVGDRLAEEYRKG